MRLAAGDRLGAYEIIAPLGEGGMGEVYRARDPRIGRDVAIKVLPASVSNDPDRLRRFEQEARAAGALNHPNVLVVHDVGTTDGTPYVVAELLEGETLGTKMAGGRLPLRKCVDYAVQIASGLAAAHAKGVVHRDLKPENLFVTHEGRVKILDFGLAKLTHPRSGSEADRETAISSQRHTSPGVILGTVGYMAPEQVRGLSADHRCDLFSFGVILYEMLIGRRAFTGDTAAETMVAILQQDPLEPSGAARDLPSGIDRVLRHCLEKSPDERFQSARDLAFHLEAVSSGADAAAPATRSQTRGGVAWWTVAGLIAGGLVAGVAIWIARAPLSSPVTRFVITPPPGVQLGSAMAFSPDGRTLVFTGSDGTGRRLYRRTFDTLDSVAIRGTEGGGLPFFSPDGAWIGFTVDRTIKKVPLQGGAATTVVDTTGEIGAATWLADDTIVFASQQRGLTRVSASGTGASEITRIDTSHGELEHHSPVALPGGRAVSFTVHFGARDSQRVDVVSLPSLSRSTLVQGNGARFLPSGHIVYQRGGTLWVAPFDQTRLTLTGPPAAVVENVAIAEGWVPVAAVADSGAIAYATGGDPFPPRRVMWVDRKGHETAIDIPGRSWFWPQVSPDGRRLGFHIMDPMNMDAWIYELDHGPLIRMTYDPRQDGYPLWTPNGKHIAFWSRQGGSTADLYLRSADMTGKDERLTTTDAGTSTIPMSWADGGRLLVFQQFTSSATKTDIGIVPIEGEHKATLAINSPADEMHPAMSPDGRWIAYQSNVSGRWEVYVQPFPSLSGRWQVSTQGGVSPIWATSGRELFFRNAEAVLSVPVTTAGSTFQFGNPTVLFEGAYVPELSDAYDARSYDLAPDGQRFLMMKEDASRASQIVVVLNWADELKRSGAPK